VNSSTQPFTAILEGFHVGPAGKPSAMISSLAPHTGPVTVRAFPEFSSPATTEGPQPPARG
jgi:hypothetical protein